MMNINRSSAAPTELTIFDYQPSTFVDPLVLDRPSDLDPLSASDGSGTLTDDTVLDNSGHPIHYTHDIWGTIDTTFYSNNLSNTVVHGVGELFGTDIYHTMAEDSEARMAEVTTSAGSSVNVNINQSARADGHSGPISNAIVSSEDYQQRQHHRRIQTPQPHQTHEVEHQSAPESPSGTHHTRGSLMRHHTLPGGYLGLVQGSEASANQASTHRPASTDNVASGLAQYSLTTDPLVNTDASPYLKSSYGTIQPYNAARAQLTTRQPSWFTSNQSMNMHATSFNSSTGIPSGQGINAGNAQNSIQSIYSNRQYGTPTHSRMNEPAREHFRGISFEQGHAGGYPQQGYQFTQAFMNNISADDHDMSHHSTDLLGVAAESYMGRVDRHEAYDDNDGDNVKSEAGAHLSAPQLTQFENYNAALSHRAAKRKTTIDDSMPSNEHEERQIVARMVDAMNDMDHAEDNRGVLDYWKSSKQNQSDIEIICWHFLHRCKKASSQDEPLAPSRKVQNLYATFGDRLDALLLAFRTQKTMCKHALEPLFIDSVVDDPKRAMMRIINNRKVNQGKKEKIEGLKSQFLSQSKTDPSNIQYTDEDDDFDDLDDLDDLGDIDEDPVRSSKRKATSELARDRPGPSSRPVPKRTRTAAPRPSRSMYQLNAENQMIDTSEQQGPQLRQTNVLQPGSQQQQPTEQYSPLENPIYGQMSMEDQKVVRQIAEAWPSNEAINPGNLLENDQFFQGGKIYQCSNGAEPELVADNFLTSPAFKHHAFTEIFTPMFANFPADAYALPTTTQLAGQQNRSVNLSQYPALTQGRPAAPQSTYNARSRDAQSFHNGQTLELQGAPQSRRLRARAATQPTTRRSERAYPPGNADSIGQDSESAPQQSRQLSLRNRRRGAG